MTCWQILMEQKRLALPQPWLAKMTVSDQYDYHLPVIHAIKEKMPHLWNGKEVGQNRES